VVELRKTSKTCPPSQGGTIRESQGSGKIIKSIRGSSRNKGTSRHGTKRGLNDENAIFEGAAGRISTMKTSIEPADRGLQNGYRVDRAAMNGRPAKRQKVRK